MDDTMQYELRKRIAAGMGRDHYPEPAWEVLVARGHLDEYAEGRISEETLIDYARRLALYGDLEEHAESPAISEHGGRTAEPPPPHGYEEQRAMTLARYLELKVAAHPQVLQLRKRLWGSTRPVPSESAYDLVEDLGMRDVVSGYRDIANHQTEPSGYLEYPGRAPGLIHRVGFYEGSNFERLRDVSEALRNDLFPLWSQAEAAWAVVTGKVKEAPKCLVGEIESFSNRHLDYATINLKAEPWISAETVTRGYQYLQSLVLGRRPRAISEKNLTMTQFVMWELRDLLVDESGRDGGPTKMSWRQLMGWWNEEHPEWAYDDERQFYRECRRIVRSVARPYDATFFKNQSSDISREVTMSIPRELPRDIDFRDVWSQGDYRP
jgi:hypothetical protein